MSDNEHPVADVPENVPKEPPPSPPPSHGDSSQDTQSDSSTDVAPTRKTRKRPENKPPPEVQESPKTASVAGDASKVNQELFWVKFVQGMFSTNAHSTVALKEKVLCSFI